MIARRLELRLDVDDAWSALAVPAGASRNRRAASRLEALWPAATAMLDPRGAWLVIGGAEAAAIGMADPPGSVGVAVCTVGEAIEAESTRCAESGALLDAVLLDAIGSAAAEAAADAINEFICAAAEARGLAAAPRESPGYDTWDVSCQRSLLALLPAADIGIAVTEGAMMVPRKSVSFAVRMLCEPVFQAADRCARCNLQRCRHRRQAGARRHASPRHLEGA